MQQDWKDVTPISSQLLIMSCLSCVLLVSKNKITNNLLILLLRWAAIIESAVKLVEYFMQQFLSDDTVGELASGEFIFRQNR